MTTFPETLYACRAQLAAYQDQCGLLNLMLEGGAKAACFFTVNEVFGEINLLPGTPVLVCAKYGNPDSNIPYIAVILWSPGNVMTNTLMVNNLMSQPMDPRTWSQYLQNAKQLFHISRQTPVRDQQPPPSKRFCPEAGSDSQGWRQTREAPGQNVNQVRARPSMSFVVTNLTEEFPERGTKAVVDKYFSKSVGQLSVVNSSGKRLQQVLFHVNHVWKSVDNSFGKQNSKGHSPFLETNTYEELEKQLNIGSTVSINARKISGTELALQATAVWVSPQPPTNYKTPFLMVDLTTKLNDFIYSQTGEEKFRSNPLYGAPDNMVEGEVKEYLSYETGLVLLQSGYTALFHLNQVWTDSQPKVLYKTVQDKLLEQYLPLGAKVWVNYRVIPAGDQSDLKYQATIVCSRTEDRNDSIPTDYIKRFQPHEARVALVAELDSLHDLFKKNLRRHRPITNTNFIPVHAILNGLPQDWVAEIVAAVDQDFGIIKISHSRDQSLGRGVHIIYSLFHIEDVYDYYGMPAIQNPNITMKNVMNCKVNLTARSICREQDPDKVMDVQRELMDGGGENGAIPLLQAVVVCLKISGEGTTNTKHIPKPTKVRDKPDSFGKLGPRFYLNPLLFAKLDLKLKAFLAIRQKLNLPYDKILKVVSIGKNHEKNMLDTWRELDINKSYSLVYGKLPSSMEAVPNIKGMMPRILTKHPVKLVYIHSNRFKADSGVFELEVEVGDEKVTTFAYFELSKYKFFTPADSFATDLVNIMKVSSTDKFCIHAMLASQGGSRIPYIALAVWNEDLRLEMKADVPLDFKFDSEYAGSIKWKIKEIVSLLKKPAPLLESSECLVDPVYPSRLAVPEIVGTVTKDVKFYDGNKVMMENKRGIVTTIINRTGYIEKILTNHHAILRFKHKEKFFKVLVSAEDVFLLDINEHFKLPKDFVEKNNLKFSSASELWALTAANKKKSLFDVLEPDQTVTFNAVPLLSNPETNNADIWYVSTGVLVTREYRQHVTVPVNCISSSSKITEGYKMYFMKIIRSVTSNSQFESDSIPDQPPAKFPPDFYEGGKGRMSLRQEYISSSIKATVTKPEAKKTSNTMIPPSLSLPAPVSVKKPPPKPIPWDPIICGRYGRVLRVIDKNYGVAASYFPLYDDSNECEAFQFLFDIFDIYVGEKDCNELGKKLPDVLSVGDFVKFNAVKVDKEVKGSERDIRYMATSMVTDSGVEDIKEREIPGIAPLITELSQVTGNKIQNFLVVAGFISNLKLSPEEVDIVNDIRSGGLLSKFASRVSKPRIPSPIVIEPKVEDDDGSDEEITVIETVSGSESKSVEIPVEDLKQKELRALISSYNSAVGKHAESKRRGKFSLQQIKEESKLERDLSFYEEFLLALGSKCCQLKKGFKVGNIFVTNYQVNSIINYGIMSKDDILIENRTTVNQDPLSEDYKEVLKQFSFKKLRKFIIDFHNFLCSKRSLEEVSKNAMVSTEQARTLMEALGQAVESAPVEGGKVQGMKVNNIFISSTWVQKIQEHHRKKKQ